MPWQCRQAVAQRCRQAQALSRAQSWPRAPPSNQGHHPRHTFPPRTNQRLPSGPRPRPSIATNAGPAPQQTNDEAGSASRPRPQPATLRMSPLPGSAPPSDRALASSHDPRKLLLPGRPLLEAPPHIPSREEAPSPNKWHHGSSLVAKQRRARCLGTPLLGLDLLPLAPLPGGLSL